VHDGVEYDDHVLLQHLDVTRLCATWSKRPRGARLIQRRLRL